MGLKHKIRGGNPAYSDPLAGAVIFDPYRDISGRNILPVGSENFVTGWASADGAVVTAIPGQADPWGGTTAVRLQITAGNATQSEKYQLVLPTVFTTGATVTAGIWAKANSGSYKITWGDRSASLTNTDFAQYTYTKTVASTLTSLYITANAANSAIDITVCKPQVNFSFSIAPYTPPAGLPASISNYGIGGSAHNAQLGSAAGSDTNDPTWGTAGLVFGADDYCKVTSSWFDDMKEFTVMMAVIPPSPSTTHRLFDKAAKYFAWGGSGVVYNQNRATGADTYTTADNLNAGVSTIVGLIVPQTTGTASIYFGNVKKSTTLSGSGSGSATSDASTDLHICNRAAADRSWGGSLHYLVVWNRALSVGEYAKAYHRIKSIMASRGVTV